VATRCPLPLQHHPPLQVPTTSEVVTGPGLDLLSDLVPSTHVRGAKLVFGSSPRRRRKAGLPVEAGLTAVCCCRLWTQGSVECAIHWAPRPDNMRVNYGTINLGVWRSGSACRLQRQTGAISLSCGDQQEQPFVQVRPEYSLSSE
jgi:hypothetical protein